MSTKIKTPLIRKDTATLGGGCFWCMEAVFEQIRGVEGVTSGYAGGTIENPSYEQICSGKTGHAEVVQIVFNPEIITYSELLLIFFASHDPTTLNRQGADVGTQYRSVIFYHNLQQKAEAEMIIKKLSDEKVFTDKIVTEISPYKKFFKAEDYHQNYYAKNPDKGYCTVVIAPKVEKIRKNFIKYLK